MDDVLAYNRSQPLPLVLDEAVLRGVRHLLAEETEDAESLLRVRRRLTQLHRGA